MMKKLLAAVLAYGLGIAPLAAQTGLAPAITIWGNATAVLAQPKFTPASAFGLPVVASCGTADDTTALQAAITAAGAGLVQVPGGVTCTVTSVTMSHANAFLQVLGTIKSKTGAVADTVIVAAANVTIGGEGIGTFDGNRASVTAQSCIRIGGTGAGGAFYSNVTIQQLNFKSCGVAAIFATNASYGSILNNNFTDLGNVSQGLGAIFWQTFQADLTADLPGPLVQGNRWDDSGRSTGVGTGGALLIATANSSTPTYYISGIRAIGNRCDMPSNPTNDGWSCLGYLDWKDFVVQGNISYGGAFGITIGTCATSAGKANVIANNTINGTNAQGYAIEANRCPGVLIATNAVDLQSLGTTGIALSNATGVELSLTASLVGNRVVNLAATANAAAYFIDFSNDILLEGNSATGLPALTFGIFSRQSHRVRVKGGILDGAGTASFAINIFLSDSTALDWSIVGTRIANFLTSPVGFDSVASVTASTFLIDTKDVSSIGTQFYTSRSGSVTLGSGLTVHSRYSGNPTAVVIAGVSSTIINNSAGTATTIFMKASGAADASGWCAVNDGACFKANSVTLADLVQGGANTMLGNWTGSTANVAANAMPSCSDTGGNHLNYVSGTGVTCGTSSASTPGGSSTQIQYNNGGTAFGGVTGFTYDGTTVTVPSVLFNGALATISGNGQGTVGATAASGLSLKGQGSSNDFTLRNTSGTVVAFVPTATTTMTLNGTVNLGAASFNSMQAAGVTTGNDPAISSLGGDTNIGIILGAKGAGAVQFYQYSLTKRIARFTSSGGNVNFNGWQFTAAASGSGPTLTVDNNTSDSNIDINITPIGTGTVKHNGNTSVISGSFALSGNITAAAWTTSGVKYANVAGTLTDTSSSGTVATAYTNVFGGNTIAATSSSTYTNYFESYFKAPVAGTNVTLTNGWALGADSLRVGTSAFLTVSTAGVVTSPQFVSNTTGTASAVNVGTNSNLGLWWNASTAAQVNFAAQGTTVGNWTNTTISALQFALTSSGSSMGDVLMSRGGAAVFIHGGADAATAVAQTVKVSSIVAGTTNGNGANWTLIGSLSTGTSGVPGDIIVQTGATGSGTTVQGAATTALTIKGVTQNLIGASTTDASASSGSGALQIAGGASVAKRFWIPAITTSSGLQTAVLCQSSGGEMIADSVACLASSARFKDIIGPLEDGALTKLAALRIERWRYKPEGQFQNAEWTRERIGPIAEDVAAIDGRIAGYDRDGSVRTYSTEQLLGLTIKALQELWDEVKNTRRANR